MISFMWFSTLRQSHFHRQRSVSDFSPARFDSRFAIGARRSLRLIDLLLLAVSSWARRRTIAQWMATDERGWLSNAAFRGSKLSGPLLTQRLPG